MGHVQAVVSHHHTTVTKHGADGRKGFVIQRCIELRRWHPGAKRAANLCGLQRPATGGPAAVVFHQFAQGQAKGPFHQTAMTNIARQLEGHGAQGTAHAVIAIELRTLGQNQRHRGQSQHVVHQRRQAEQTLQGRNWRLGTNDPALAFEGVQQRGFFTTDVSTGTDSHFHIEGLAAAADIGAEVTGVSGDVQRRTQRGHSIGIFRANIDVAVSGPDAETGNGHAFDQQEGVAFHQHAVGESAGVAFVGVAYDVLLRSFGRTYRAPFDPGGESRAATATQA
ncbi:hypothetical protein D3C85_1216480 [compost metagenome]